MRGVFINKNKRKEEVELLWQEYAIASGVIKLKGRHNKLFFFDPDKEEIKQELPLIEGRIGHT
jgi:hypothetical protein